MSLTDRNPDTIIELSPAAQEGLDRVLYCAGSRCLTALGIACDIQSRRYDEEVAEEVAAQVGAACLKCKEVSVEPLGTVYEAAEVDRLLAEA